ncbi:MAG: glycosyltransferase [Sphingobacteriaceae bacterium]|nr:glycosyltransferase [Sphingobacteriaceae bacterium]
MAARDEAEKIGFTISDILAQDYPKHLVEIIVVDDHSTDETANVISAYAEQGVRLIRLNEANPLNSYKKKALTEAIKIAGGELIVATDADCRMGKQWLSTIVSMYEEKGYNLISSPVSFYQEKTFFEELQTLEFQFLIGLGASTIGNKMPSTCNGANLAYRKDVFDELKGFAGIDDLASGDDELFLHKVAAKYPNSIGFCKAKEAVVYTHAKPNLKEFVRQRKRWASKSTRYKNKWMVVIGVSIWLFNLSILLSFLSGFFYDRLFLLGGATILLKFFVELVFMIPVTSFFRRSRLLLFLPLLTIGHIFYFIYIGIAGNSGKYIWKGRLVN